MCPEFSPEQLRRIELTTAVRDTDKIAKVHNAGETVLHNGTRAQVMHCGVLVEEDCYYGSWTTEVIRRLRGHHEPQEEAVFHELIERLRQDTPAPVLVELGSYWAYYALWAKHAIPETACFLVDPDPANLRIGQRNFALNGVEGRFISAAVGRTHGGRISIRCESDSKIRKVTSITVDGLLATEPLERIDLLVCDVQGSELDMLRGARKSIREGRIRFLVISTHLLSTNPLIHQACLSLLEEMGAHIVAEHSIPESCSGDGLIVASLDPRDAGFTVDITIGRARDSVVGELEWHIAKRSGWRGLARQLGGPLWRRGRAIAQRFAKASPYLRGR